MSGDLVSGDIRKGAVLSPGDDSHTALAPDTAAMSQTTAAAPRTGAGARQAADAAAVRAGVEVRELADLARIEAASQLFDQVWTDPSQTIMPVNLVRALSASGSYVAGAFAAGKMVGAIVGFLGLHGTEMVVHSHILGVLPETRGRSVGFALKVDQRAWCIDRGVRRVLWTFDPLVSRNAYFNLSKLGAVGARYETNFYGSMDDGLNTGDETDRLVAVWNLLDPQVESAAAGQPATRPSTDGASVLLDVGPDGGPQLRTGNGDRLRCRVPRDIIAVRETEPALARRWRYALRDTLGAAVSDGFSATGMDRNGWYTLTRSGEV